MKNKKKFLYISIDGIMDPIGRSQIEPYLISLSTKYDLSVITFEKNKFFKKKIYVDTLKRLKENKISWYKFKYFETNFSFIKLINFTPAIFFLLYIFIFLKIKNVHLRSYLPGIILFPFIKFLNIKYIFDIRGFWPEERIDRLNWSKNDIKYKIVKFFEKKLLINSHTIVCLTNESKLLIQNKYNNLNEKSFSVIPTCSDKLMFKPIEKRNDDKIVLGYFGSISNAYNINKVLNLFSKLLKYNDKFELRIYTHDAHNNVLSLIKKNKIEKNYLIETLERSELNKAINNIDFGIFYLNVNYSVKASFPTKISEYLLCGKPIICNNFNEDITNLVNKNTIGMIIDFENTDIKKLLSNIYQYKNNQNITKNCLKISTNYLDLEYAINQYSKIYDKM